METLSEKCVAYQNVEKPPLPGRHGPLRDRNQALLHQGVVRDASIDFFNVLQNQIGLMGSFSTAVFHRLWYGDIRGISAVAGIYGLTE